MPLFRICCLFVAVVLLQTTHLNATEFSLLDQTADYARSAKSLVEGYPTDLMSVIDATGTDPKAIADWVHNNISYESYVGIRKGAEGTLISGSGNSADQALLVASLLEYVGIQCKLVKGTTSNLALPQLSVDNVAFESNQGLPSVQEMEALAKKTGVDIETVYDQVESALRSRQNFQEALWSRTLNDLDVLSKALDDAGIPLPAAKGSEAGDVDHWWVRTELVDYDTVLQKPLQTSDAEYQLNELPESLFHKITVRMWIQRSEEIEGDITIQDPESVLNISFHSAELVGNPLTVGNIPLDIESKLTALQNPTSAEIIETFSNAKQFQPQLSSPRGLLSGHPFDKSGNKLSIKDGRIEAVKKIGSATGGMFGSLMGGGEEEPKAKSRLIAHWLEIELESAGGRSNTIKPVVIRRDLLKHPDSKTNSLEILTMREVLVQGDELSGAWLTRKSLEHMIETVEHTKWMFDAGLPKDKNALELYQLSAHRPRMNQELFTFGLARKSELLRLKNKVAPDARFVKTHPMVVTMVTGFNCPDDQIYTRSGLDILHQAFEVQNHTPKRWKDSLTFATGILDTALELTVMADHSRPEMIRNTSLLLEQATETGMAPLVVQKDDSIQIQVKDDQTGEILGFYDVNATTGMSLGMMDGGGQAMTEYAEIANIVLQLRGVVTCYADFIKCMLTVVIQPLSGAPQPQMIDYSKCIFDVVCGNITNVVGVKVDVAVNWTNVILVETVNQIFGQVCKKISDSVF